MEIEVKGHSGCQIDIVRENRDLFVYKSSHDIKYLPRLVKQAEKQKKAALEEYQHVRIPQIYSLEQDSEHVSVKMEYVYSRNFIEYFESAGFEQIDYFIKALVLYVEKELKVSPVVSISTRITLEKYLDVEKKVMANSLLKDDIDIKNLMSQSKQRFEDLANQPTIELPIGLCHGDLTFSNILFNGNNYYLIDFLDSFIESPLMDIVKIRQDSAHLWSQLMYVHSYDKLRLKIICEKIDNDIDRYFSKYDWYKNYYNIYQLMNMLRILQYAKEKSIISYLKEEISNLLTGKFEITSMRECLHNCENENFCLIVPAAADNSNQPDVMPYVFSLDFAGVMHCIRAIQGLNLKRFDNIYFTILRKHVDLFCLDELFKQQFKRLGMDNANLVILDNPTDSQTETIYQTLLKVGNVSSLFVKDADGYFEAEIQNENGVAVFPLEQLNMLDPQHKSYVAVDDMYYLTNIIEKKVISHFFNVGGVCFENADDFMFYYERLQRFGCHLCMSHIVYAMLMDKHQFRPIVSKSYIDWGNEQLFKYYHQI